MKFTQFKKWFSVMAFAVTALFVTQTVRADRYGGKRGSFPV